MDLLALLAAGLVVLGLPGAAAAASLRSRPAASDRMEMLAAAYGGVGVACVSLWVAARLFGTSLRVLGAAPVIAALVLIAPLAVRRGRHDGEGPFDRATAPARSPARAPLHRRHLSVLGAAAAAQVLLVCLPFVSFGLQRADGIHRMAMTDWYKHLVVTTAVASADSFPPPNPFVHAAEKAPYYYGFHLVAASIGRLSASWGGAVDADPLYAALLLLTLLTAAATPLVAYAVARQILAPSAGSRNESSRTALVAALGATFLAGFDLIPLAIDSMRNLVAAWPLPEGFGGLRAVIPSSHLDYWIHHNERQFNAPYVTAIWAPQHLAAALVALLAIHLVWRRRSGGGEPPPDSDRLSWLLPSVLLASLPALSAYVAIGLAVGVAGATVFECIDKRRFPRNTAAWRAWSGPAGAAAILASPILMTLSAAGPSLVPRVPAAGGWVNGAFFSALFGAGWLPSLLDSPAVYVVELGIIGVLAFAEIRGRARDSRLLPAQGHLVGVVVGIMLLVVFVRPPVGGPNNLYARPLLLVWFLLAPFAAARFLRCSEMRGVSQRADSAPGSTRAKGKSDRWQRCIVVGGILCLLGTGYAVTGAVAEGFLFWAAPIDTVEAAVWINGHLKAAKLVAVHPDRFVSAFGYWLRRPMAAADERHALLFGAEQSEFTDARAGLRSAYEAPTAIEAAEDFDALAVDVVLVAVGSSPPSWAASPCFREAHRNDTWLIVQRTLDGCPTGGERR